jgi:hypothetical protein
MIEFQEIGVKVLNAVLMAALPALAVSLTGAVIAWARKTWAEFKRTEPKLSDQVAFYVRIAVEAAEQAGAAKLVEDKKRYALDIAQRWLKQNGLGDIDVELIAAEIERQVRDMKRLEAYANL